MIVERELGVSAQFWPKNNTRNIGNIHKDFELHQVFMQNFLCQNVLILLSYILLAKRINMFSSKGINKFSSERISTVQTQKSQTKSQEYLERFLELHQFLIHNFLCQPFHGIQTSYYSTNPILCHCLPHLTVFSLLNTLGVYIYFLILGWASIAERH